MRRTNQNLKDECERLLSSVLRHGDKRRIAKGLGVSLSEVSQQVNPEEIRASDYYRFKEFLTVLCGINQEAARVVAADIQATVDNCDSADADMKELTGLLAKEHTEVILAHLQAKPFHVQRKEWLDVRNAADRGLRGLEQAQRKGSKIATAQPTKLRRIRA